MATQTLELFDGVTTLDLIDTTNYDTQYTPGLGIPRAPNIPTIAGETLSAIEFKPREIRMTVDVVGTSQADLTANIAALERMVAVAQERQIRQNGTTKVVLTVQQGTAAANDVKYTVLTGSFSLDTSVIRGVNIARIRTRGVLTLLVEARGKLPDVTMGRKTLHNEIDGTNINYVDIGDGWGGFFAFDGAATLVNCGTDSSLEDTFDGGGTARVRFRITGTSESSGFIIDHGDNFANGWAFYLSLNQTSSSTPAFRVPFSGTNGLWLFDNNLDWNRWYVAEIDYDADATGNNPTITVHDEEAGTTSIYTVGSGLTESSTPVGTRVTSSGEPFVIGNSKDASDTFLGDISEVALYSAAGISDSLTQELDGNESSLVGLWNFGEGTGTALRDNSSNTNTGTITAGSGVWGIDPTGANAGGLLQVRIEDENSDPWVGSANLYLGTKSGERRTDVLFDDVPDSVTDVDNDILAGAETGTKGTTGGPTANTSGGTSAFFKTVADATSGLQEGFTIRGYFTFQPSSLPRGLYRVLARCQLIETAVNVNIITSVFGFALSYNFGGVTTTPVEAGRVQVSTQSQWELLDLGELSIPPLATPDGFTDLTLSIRVNAVLNKTGADNMQSPEFIEWSCDHIFLLPIDEGSVIASSISASDELLADLISDPPGVWELSTSSVTQKFADFNGAPIRLSPEATRLYWMRDDTDDPSLTVAYAYIKYTPLVQGV